MTLPGASYSVWRGQARMPKRGERHGPRPSIVDVAVVAAERLCPGLHSTGLGALRSMGYGHAVVSERV
jgi:hypothetical protein